MSQDINWDIFFDIHKGLPRQGSGRKKYTIKAYTIIPRIKKPKILDIGCGPGLQTIDLAEISIGELIAIDIHQPYLDQLNKLIIKEKLQDRIKTINKSMFNMDFSREYFDIIWAEGSIFIIGFENGLRNWKKYLKNNGYMAIHEMTWLRDNPPKEIMDYWMGIYPEINTIESNLELIKKCGYNILDYFALDDDAWWDFYYNPLEKRLIKMRKKYKKNKKALDLIESEQKEINLYKKYNKWYGSVFYIITKMSNK
jgi:ubiquinone/menaquinone biosynthesis C-methylase UbiE